MSNWTRALAVAGCCAYPILNHAAAVQGEPRWAALGIALLAWALAAGWARASRAALVMVFTLAVAFWLAGAAPRVLLVAPPAAINLALCLVFARTMRRGHEPLVSRFARLERGGYLAPDLVRYTRRLTGLWAVFFAAMAMTSLVLAAGGSVAAWSLFTNVLNYLFVVLFFISEYAYRRLRYRHHQHASPWQMIRRLRHYKVFPRSPTQA